MKQLVQPNSAISVHFQLTCPRCGSDKFNGDFSAVIFAKCIRCEYIWQWVNRVPDTTNTILSCSSNHKEAV